jgi:hypothetical protein
MAYRKYGALIASFGAVALVFAASQALARSGAAHGVAGAKHPLARHQALLHRHFRNNNGNNNNNGFWTAWPYDDYSYGSTPGEAPLGLPQPVPGDIRNSQAYDIPWDWAHRYPPLVTPGDKPYVPTCPAEAVTVPGHDGKEQTVNITRCY